MDGVYRKKFVIVVNPKTILCFLSQLIICAYGLAYYLGDVFGISRTILTLSRIASIGFAILGFLFGARPVLKLNRFFCWYGVLIALSYISSLYSINTSAFANTTYLFEIGLVAMAFCLTIDSEAAIKRFLCMMAISGGIVFLVLNSKGLLYIDDRLGRTLTEGNSNSFAEYIMLTLIACVMMFCLTEKKVRKILFVILGILDVYMLLLSGGRKYILVPLIMCVILIWHFTKNVSLQKKILAFAGALIVILFVWNFIMTNEIVYMSIGRRFESGEGNEGRLDLIYKGLRYFWGRPIFGYGENAYSILHSMEVGYEFYSHNNYIELLVNMGLIGFLWYYGFFFETISKLHKRRNQHKLHIIFEAFLLSMLFLYTGTVAYNSSSLSIEFIAIAFCLLENNFTDDSDKLRC